MKDEPAVTKFQRIFDRSSLLVKSMFTSFWPRPITYCTKYTQQFLKSMTHTICFLTYYIWREGLPATSEQPWHLCFPLFHLVLMVVSLEDISRLLWVSQGGATSGGVSLRSQWRMFLVGEILSSLFHLQLTQKYSSVWGRTSSNLVGMTSWLGLIWMRKIFVVQCCDGIYRDMSPRQQVNSGLRPLEVVAVAFQINLTRFVCGVSKKITPAWNPSLADLKLTPHASPRGRTSPTWLSTPHHRRRWTCSGSTPAPLGLTSLLPGFSWNIEVRNMRSWQLQTWGNRRHLYFEAL